MAPAYLLYLLQLSLFRRNVLVPIGVDLGRLGKDDHRHASA